MHLRNIDADSHDIDIRVFRECRWVAVGGDVQVVRLR
jgi:hypothetical protein